MMPRWRKQDCAHGLLRAIYGDEINLVGGYRLQCIACGRFLRGPAALAEHRKSEKELWGV